MQAGQALSLGHRAQIRAWIEHLTCGQQRLSEHAFANLYLFRHVHDYRLIETMAMPVIAGNTYDGIPHWMPLCPLDNDAAETLLSQAMPGTCLYPLAAWQIDTLDPQRFAWTDNAADADYLYAAPQFVTYAGERLRKKRQQMQQLLARHTVRVEPLTPWHTVLAQEVLTQWMQDKQHAHGGADERPCREALHLADSLGLAGYFYWADAQPAGFLLVEPLGKSVYVVRFAKGLDRFKGLYPFMFHHFARQHPDPACWMNFEQDLGLENFRRAKRSFQPNGLLRKFRLTLRHATHRHLSIV